MSGRTGSKILRPFRAKVVHGGGSAEATIAAALEVLPHLSATPLGQRSRDWRDVKERERLHCVLRKSRGHSAEAIAAMFREGEDRDRRTGSSLLGEETGSITL